MKKGLARLIFLVVFFIPVAWYLFLQFFGDNSFTLELKEKIDASCGTFTEVIILIKTDSISLTKQNYLQRVRFEANKRAVQVVLNNNIFHCIDKTESDLVLLDERGLWGSYSLSRHGVDLLLTELDILKKSHAKGTSR